MAVCIVKTKQEAKAASKLAQILPQINQLQHVQHVYLWYDKTFFLAESFLSSLKRKTGKIFPENFPFSVKLMP